MSGINSTDYLYLSACLRARERSLVSRERLERMVSAPDDAEAAKILTECGYPELAGTTDTQLERAFSERRRAALDEMEKLCPEKALVDAFRLRYDYHNAKVLVKADGADASSADLLSDCGRVAAQTLAEAYAQDQWRAVPGKLSQAIRQARGTLARTANPQLVDFGLDRAYFAELLAIAQTLSTDFLTRYARLCVDTANLRSAVRCLRAHMDEGVLQAALIDGGSVPAGRVARRAYTEGVQSVYTQSALLKAAALGQQAAEGGPLADFERACDNALTRFLAEGKYVSFGPEVVVAYIACLEGEIVAARMILTGKRGGISEKILRERLRDSYV